MSEENQVVSELVTHEDVVQKLADHIAELQSENKASEDRFDNLALMYDRSQDVLRMVRLILHQTDNDWRGRWTHGERGTISKLCMALIDEALPGGGCINEQSPIPF